LTNFTDALQALNFNFDLAYSMLVYSLEALFQDFDGYSPKWQDYSQNEKIDDQLITIDSVVSENIRNIILEEQHLKLQRRFIDFISSHINNSFFCEEAATVQNALRKSSLEQALKNVYTSRSKYVHQLSSVQSVQDHLKYSSSTKGDVFYWYKQPYLTFDGLVRLTYHVITSFIAKQDYLVQEEYDYYKDIPGILKYRINPESWIGNEQYFSSDQAKEWLSDFLEILQTPIVDNKPIPDMKKIIEKIELTIKGIKQEKQRILLVIHKLLCFLTGDCERYNLLKKSYPSLVNKCHIELMIANLILDESLPWELSECIKNYEDFSKKRFNKDTVRIPHLIEIFLIVSIANMSLEDNQLELYDTWLDAACLEAAGMQTLQSLIQKSRSERMKIQLSELVKSLQQSP
jgi:hypothetical protein